MFVKPEGLRDALEDAAYPETKHERPVPKSMINVTSFPWHIAPTGMWAKQPDRACPQTTGYMISPKSACGFSSISPTSTGTMAASMWALSRTWARLVLLFQVAPPWAN